MIVTYIKLNFINRKTWHQGINYRKKVHKIIYLLQGQSFHGAEELQDFHRYPT